MKKKFFALLTVLAMMLTLLPVTVMADDSKVTAILDKTNYTGSYLRVVAYNNDGSRAARLDADCDNFASMEFPKDCLVQVMALEEFTVSVEGATVGPMQSGEELYCYEVTGFTKDTTIVINPEPSAEDIVSTFEVQFDWSKVPLLKAGMSIESFIPEGEEGIGIGDAYLEESPASVSGSVDHANNFGWAIRVDESHLIDENEADEIIAKFGDTDVVIDAIVEHNENVTTGIELYNGWLPLEIFLSDACTLGYVINETDIYAVWIGVEAEDGKIFAEPNENNEYSGEINCNVEVGSSIYTGDDELVVFFRLGTLAEMEAEKNEGSAETNPPIEDEKGNVDVDTKVDAEAPVQNITLGNSEKELLENSNIFKEEEKELIASGVDSKVWLEVGKVDVESLDENYKVKFEEAAGSATNIVYFEADLFKQVGTAEPEKVPSPGVKIKITFAIPSELLNKDENVERTYKILRLHNGIVEPISGEFNAETGEFTFETDKFSTYGIVWTDTVKSTGTTPGTDTDQVPGIDTEPAPGTDTAPNSGDSAMVGLYVILVAVASAVVLKRKNATSV